MFYIQISFSLCLTIIFLVELLEEKKKWKAILVTFTYILFAIIVSNRAFF